MPWFLQLNPGVRFTPGWHIEVVAAWMALFKEQSAHMIIRGVDPVGIQMAKVYGLSGPQTLRQVILPSAMSDEPLRTRSRRARLSPT